MLYILLKIPTLSSFPPYELCKLAVERIVNVVLMENICSAGMPVLHGLFRRFSGCNCVHRPTPYEIYS